MSAIRAWLTRPRTFRIERDWSILVLIVLTEIGACVALWLLAPRETWIPILALYLGCAPLYLLGSLRPALKELLLEDSAKLSYLMLLSLGAITIDALACALVVAVAAVLVAAAAVCVVAALVIGIGFVVYGFAWLLIHDWWVIAPMALIYLVYKAVSSRLPAFP